MKKLACKDINKNTTCDYEATGESAKEVAEKMVAHAKAHHAGDVQDMTDDEMMQSFESKVHE